jgi:hypothetical protein
MPFFALRTLPEIRFAHSFCADRYHGRIPQREHRIEISVITAGGFCVTQSGKSYQASEGDIVCNFYGGDMAVDGDVFDGAELTAVFGGVKCDLRKAVIDHDCAIEVSAVFGGIDILVPDHINVRVNSAGLFGGFSNKTPARKDVPTLYISGICLFGGVDIK